MPRVLDDKDWNLKARTTKHDWSLLMNGKKWELIQGVDFTCKTASFRTLFHRSCAEAGLKAHTVRIKQGNKEGIRVCAVPPGKPASHAA
jgi:hypothetical protein